MRIISCSYLTANERQCQPKIGSLHDQVYDPKGRANALAVKDSAVTLELVYGVRVTVDKRRDALAVVGLGPIPDLDAAALDDAAGDGLVRLHGLGSLIRDPIQLTPCIPIAILKAAAHDTMVKSLGLDHPAVADIDTNMGCASKQQQADDVWDCLDAAFGLTALLESADVDVLRGDILGRTRGRAAPEIALDQPQPVMHALANLCLARAVAGRCPQIGRGTAPSWT